MKPHKHAELIKAWADGAEIEERYIDRDVQEIYKWEKFDGDWSFTDRYEYRIKPEPKPNAISYVFCTKGGTLTWMYNQIGTANLKLTFDGETGELKSAEVLK